MLNEERVRLMTKLAAYESTQGEEDIRISSYYRKDYTSLNTLITILWLTVGYAILALLVVLGNLELVMKNLAMNKIIILGAIVVGAYFVLVVIYGVCASSFYRGKYNKAKQRVKQYYRDLSRLGKLYMKEK